MLRRTLGDATAAKAELRAARRIVAARGQLEAALLNLAANARDGGTPTFSTHVTAIRTAAADQAPGEYGIIDVIDTGQGMTPDAVARAFEPFHVTKEVGRGAGPGSSQVHGFAGPHGGHIAIDSRIREGTTVRIHLPIEPEAALPDRVDAEA